ncbi:MAG: hypothetical protein ABJF01_06340 [bacterium]
MKRWLLLSSVLALACRERAPGGDGPFADKVALDIPQIEKALGVKFKTPPKLELRSRDEVRAFLVAKLREPEVVKQIANQEATYKLLGMLPDTLHLGDLFVRVLSEQILGYYDPKTKVLYVVKGAPEDYAGITIMHELIHALQDQYVNLDSLEHISGDDDRAGAVQAVIEGQATYEQIYLMSGGSGNVAAQLPGGWESMRTELREAQKTQPVFSSAPMVIQETLLFPYVNGSEFIRRYKGLHKAQLPFDRLPVSTEQLMHDSAFFAKTPDVPSEVTLPPIVGNIDQNNLGEFGTRLFVYQHTRDQDLSIRASNGWDGDRYALVKTPAGNALVWVTVWDTPGDGAEFMAAIDAVVAKRFNVKPRVTGELRHFDAGKRTIEVNVREIDGRPVVLYVEVPAGASTALVDFSKVKVTPR